MKDDLIALLEAMRLVRAEIDGTMRFANPSDSMVRIEKIFADPELDAALRRLDPDGDAMTDAVPTSRHASGDNVVPIWRVH